ncbi:hypothetical protein MKW92_049377 [Papaver armeniacum]|nr:hypothetical protein MKW92_049377 [Papaver armeniacum]
MDSDQGKLFIGGISWDTTEEKLTEYFGKYGEVVQTVIMRDKITGRPRGFGFVVFADPSILDMVLQDKHTIDGRTVEAKRALSKEEQHTSVKSGNPSAGRNFGGGGNIKTKKIFVGGLPPTLTEDGFRSYFEQYGTVTDVVVMYDQSTQRPRGFGFISFESEDSVDNVLTKSFHDLNGKLVEVKRALPKDANPGGGGNGGGRSGGGGYQGYGGSGGNGGAYDARMDANRYVQPQTGGGGFPYGSAGYGGGGYGYGAANNGVGYGGYGYGGASAGFSGPAGPYGNPNAPNAGYVSGPPGAPRSPWGAQAPSGFGSAGYGANAGYGNTAPWNASGAGGAAGNAGAGSAPTGQSPSGAAGGFGSQGYGYGGYGGSDGSYAANQGSYGAVGGRAGSTPTSNGGASGGGGDQQGSGYFGGDANSGFWRSDASQAGAYGAAQATSGGQMGYGGSGYGGAQSRQAQQQ